MPVYIESCDAEKKSGYVRRVIDIKEEVRGTARERVSRTQGQEGR